MFCSKCGAEVDKEDQFCKKCGARLADLLSAPHIPQTRSAPFPVGRGLAVNRKLVLWCIAGAFILWFLLNIGTHNPESHPTQTIVTPQPPAKPDTFSLKDTVHVGYWSYVVWDKEWQRTLDSGSFHKRADAEFLVLNMTVRNDDDTASVMPPFKLVDYEGREYDETSTATLYLPGSFGLLKTVNPGVRADGYIAFDVPRGAYRLKVSGGFKSGKTALINLY
jgi:Domain of unknown function (DUF4352)/zinc-ribbon domain